MSIYITKTGVRTEADAVRISYDLSNRQKDALNKGQTLTLAIPLDPEGDDVISGGVRDEISDWLQSKLPKQRNLYLEFKGVFPVVLEVKTNPVGSPLSKRLGTIMLSDKAKTGFVMDVATVEVFNPDRARTDAHRIQWPGGQITLEG